MVTPNHKRITVVMLQDRFGVSQRQACRVTGQHRSTQRHQCRPSSEEAFLRRRLRAMAAKFPRYGYRRIHVMLIRDGFHCNRKRIQRLWRAEGLHVGQRKRRKPKTRRNQVQVRVGYPDHVWAIDFQFDETPRWSIRQNLERDRRVHTGSIGMFTSTIYDRCWHDDHFGSCG